MGPASTARRRTSQMGSGPANPTPRAPHEAFLDFISPRGAGGGAANRRGSLGRYFAHSISPGGSVVRVAGAGCWRRRRCICAPWVR